jgi:hypothetical protein
MDPFMLAKLIETAINVGVRVFQVWRNDDGTMSVIEYAKGTHSLNQQTLQNLNAFLAQVQPAPIPVQPGQATPMRTQ